MPENPVTPVRDSYHYDQAIHAEICLQDGFPAAEMKFFSHVKTF